MSQAVSLRGCYLLRNHCPGSVYWSKKGEHTLQNLDNGRTLEAQLAQAFSYPFSPNWQDASTQQQCDEFDHKLGNEIELAMNTGSKAHHVRHISFALEIIQEKDPRLLSSFVTYKYYDPSRDNQYTSELPEFWLFPG